MRDQSMQPHSQFRPLNYCTLILHCLSHLSQGIKFNFKLYVILNSFVGYCWFFQFPLNLRKIVAITRSTHCLDPCTNIYLSSLSINFIILNHNSESVCLFTSFEYDCLTRMQFLLGKDIVPVIYWRRKWLNILA